MSKQISKTSDIRLKIGLNEQRIPVDIKWQASDSSHEELRDCKSFALHIWDPVEKNTLGIQLWTNEMMADEMHAHFFQSILQIAENYHKATGNPHVKKATKEFCENLSKMTDEWEKSRGK